MKKNERVADQAPKANENGDIVLDNFKNAKRYNSSNLKIVTDLFKLNPAVMLKNVGSDDKQKANILPMEHCHYFRTYDSNGKKMTGTNIVGGHYHNIEVSVNENGDFVCKCSLPMQNKKSEKIWKNDNHTHELIYVKSEEVELRKFKPEAIRSFNMGMDAPVTTNIDASDLTR